MIARHRFIHVDLRARGAPLRHRTQGRWCVALAISLCTSLAYPRDLGVIGPVYPIAEQNLLDWIAQRLRAMQASGELQRLQDEAVRRGVDHVEHPAPVPGLSKATESRTFYFDPTFTLDRNLVGPDGHLMFVAGTRKNPLEVLSLSRHLLFFDGRDAAQVERARSLLARYGGKLKPILTGGSYLDLIKIWHVPVYYDQFGALTRRLGITRVPALVSQEGLRLRIDELGEQK